MSQLWYSAAELQGLALKGLPRSKRKINELAAEQGWALKSDSQGIPLARPRKGRGGGLEYHIELLPHLARLDLIKRGLGGDAQPSAETTNADQLWAWFDNASDAIKQEAHRRAQAIGKIDLFRSSGMTQTAAVAAVSAAENVSPATLYNWLKAVKGISPANRLPYLADRRQGGGKEADVHPAVWDYFKSDYLRPERPTYASVYERAKEIAAHHGVSIPHLKTFQRKLEREVDARIIVARRQGMDALRQTLPPQKRSVADLHALELVNIDGHKWDVFVRMPDGRIMRPMMVAIQDIYSRKFLAWRIGESENAVQTRLTFGDLFAKFGIPKGCVLDNGRAFASKWITGGAKSRFRFKIRDDEATGLLTALGIEIHWAKPYRGSSKPIERGFRDMCDGIAKHPAFAGAYTGNKPDAKPENYGDKAVDFELFCAVVDKCIAAHNARSGRRTETAQGRSFDEAFAESYARAAIGKATPEQLRMALLMAEDVRCDRKSGHVTLFGNRYWSPQLSAHAGERLCVRFDPDDLTKDIHLYSREGAYLFAAPMLEATGFLDVAAAKRQAKLEGDLRKSVKAATEAERLLSADQLAAMLPAYEDETAPIEPSVIRPVRHRGQTAAALKPVSEAHEKPMKENVIDRIARLRLVE